MFNPSNDSNSPLSSRIALPVGLLLAGTFGLTIALTLPPKISKTPNTSAPDPAVEKTTEQPSKSRSALPVNTDLVQFCSQHVTENRSFVVFSRGTCVMIEEPCKKPLEEARRLLSQSNQADARFVPAPTDNGDLIITFKDPIFHRFSQRQIKELTPWIDQVAETLLTPSEAIEAGENWNPHPHAKLGLLARRRMLEDAKQQLPIRVIRARKSATEAKQASR